MIDVCGINTPQELQTAFMLSASFHSGSREGSFTGPQGRPIAKELLEQFKIPPTSSGYMELGAIRSVSYQGKDINQLLSMFRKAKMQLLGEFCRMKK
ncbi:uncharacterized protein LOC144634453 isoform X1 [Oculina patagonica]